MRENFQMWVLLAERVLSAGNMAACGRKVCIVLLLHRKKIWANARLDSTVGLEAFTAFKVFAGLRISRRREIVAAPSGGLLKRFGRWPVNYSYDAMTLYDTSTE